MERLETELPNIRAALDWYLTGGQAEPALRLGSALNRFWRAHGHVSEARGWLSAGLALGDDVPPDVRAKALWVAARQARAQSDHGAAEPLLEQALALFQEVGDLRNAVFALSELGWLALQRRDHLQAFRLCELSLTTARALGDPRAISGALNTLGGVADGAGDHTRARNLHAEALALRRTLGDPLLVANSAYNLGVAGFRDGDLPAAGEAFSECLALAREIGDSVHIAGALCCLGEVALEQGELELAEERLRESIAIFETLGNERAQSECLHGLAGVAAAAERPDEAVRLWAAAEEIRHRLGAPLEPAERAIEQRLRERGVLAPDVASPLVAE